MATRRRGLRFRVMAAFALGGLLVPATLSVFTFFWARTYLVDQRDTSAVHQADANAQLLRAMLRAPRSDVASILTSLATPSSAQSAVLRSGQWFGTSAVAGPDTLPTALVSMVVEQGQPARQRYHRGGEQVLAVGIPLSSRDAYFEIFSLADLTSTLATLRDSLAAGSLIGFVVSLAIGAWATRRVLKPVRDIGAAAASIASGKLDARLDAEGDQELVELATGFNAMLDSLRNRIERDARFASDVSHELRSPLTTLHSATDLMLARRDSLDARSARALDLLSGEVGRFEHLVEDLLEISRYDAGVAHLDLEPVDLAALVSGVLAEADQKVTPSFAGVSTRILADRRRLVQALRNIVGNAVVHAGGVSAMSVRVGPEHTEIVIEDRGPGISGEDVVTVFDRFARGSVAGNRSSGGGVGLGLALVAEHVGLQGGSVRVEPVEPCGSRFVVELPTRRP